MLMYISEIFFCFCWCTSTQSFIVFDGCIVREIFFLFGLFEFWNAVVLPDVVASPFCFNDWSSKDLDEIFLL